MTETPEQWRARLKVPEPTKIGSTDMLTPQEITLLREISEKEELLADREAERDRYAADYEEHRRDMDTGHGAHETGGCDESY